MMNKKMIALTLCAALAVTATACGKSAPASSAPAASSEAASEKTAADFENVDLRAIYEANILDKLQEYGKNITSDYSYTNPDGSDGGSYTTNLILTEQGPFSYYKGVEDDVDGTQYDYESVTGTEARFEQIDYPNGTMNRRMTPMTNYDKVAYGVSYDETEQVVDRQYADGVLTVTTQLPADEDLKSFFGDVSVVNQQYDYIVDAETLQLQGLGTYAVEADGTRHTYMEMTNTFADSSNIQLPEYVTEYLAAPPTENLRTVTIINAEDGTEQSFKLPNNWLTNADLFLNMATDYTLYSDEACTTEYTGVLPNKDGSYPDMTVYVKPAA